MVSQTNVSLYHYKLIIFGLQKLYEYFILLMWEIVKFPIKPLIVNNTMVLVLIPLLLDLVRTSGETDPLTFMSVRVEKHNRKGNDLYSDSLTFQIRALEHAAPLHTYIIISASISGRSLCIRMVPVQK